MAEKINYLKEWKTLYQPPVNKPVLVDVPAHTYLMIDGSGDPNTSSEYQAAIQTLFSLSYALKFTIKKEQGIDYGVLPLEGLWWGTPQGQHIFTSEDKARWYWTAMILQPDPVTAELVERVSAETAKKKDLPAASKVRFETLHEGLSMQAMHIGSFDAEGPLVDLMARMIQEGGYRAAGKHHEIYLSDFRRTAPEKLRTIIRHPVEKA